jgi:hypothetical protein
MADNEMVVPLGNHGASTTTAGCSAAAASAVPVTQKSESTSPGEKPADLTAGLPTASKVVIIESTANLKRRAFVINATLVVAEQNKAKVAATNGRPWSVSQAHIDGPKSSKYGISLAAGLSVIGIERLNRGDLVQIEIGRGDTCYQLTGRASRKAAAYFAKTDLAQSVTGLAQIGAELHTPFHYVVLGVTSPSQVEGSQP